MKTYCKRKDISNIDFVKNCITPFLHERLDKSNVAKLFAYYNGISNTKSRKNIDTFPEYVSDTIDKIAESISESLKSRTVVEHVISVTANEAIVTYREIVDGISGKRRELGLEKLIFQLYEVIARDACQEMFDAKIGEFQVSSIKGKGQSYGKKYIKKWISMDPEGTKFCAKADVKKCYPSIPHNRLKELLHRDLRKSEELLYLLDSIIYLYDCANLQLGRPELCGKGILIGSPLSKDLNNYYMSYLYHYIYEQLAITTVRRGKEKRTRLVSHAMIYADDIVVFGGNKKHLHQAMRLIIEFTKNFLGLEVKSTWEKFLVSYNNSSGKSKGRNLDFMGFVFRGCEAFYREYGKVKKRLKKVIVTVRDSIFLRARRKFYLFIKLIRSKAMVTKHKAMSLLAYNGWIKNSDSHIFQEKEHWKEVIRIAKRMVSRYEKGKPYETEKYYKKVREIYA